MKKFLLGMIACSALLFAAPADAASVADYTTGATAGGIGSSRHNMGGFGRVIRTTNTTEICVFCHTPHHANQSDSVGPLWNRKTQAPATYTAYGTTIGGTTVSTVGSTTLACLSCHDGITTFDNIVNAPGKAGVVDGGADRGWLFAMPVSNEFLPPSVAYHKFDTGLLACTLCHSDDQTQRLTIGTNLSNDHPVSITYDPAKGGLRPTDTVIGSIDLTSDLAASATTAYGGNLMQNRWAVKGYISDTASIGDLLRSNKVECSSCHDPHFRNLSWDEAEPTWTNNGALDAGDGATWCGNVGENCSDGQFLRRVGGNTGSGVCRTCHNK